jgi:hypothetical protein
MNRKKIIKHLLSQFEEKITRLPEHKLKGLESGKLEINLTQPVGKEAGGAGGIRRVTSPTAKDLRKRP